MYLRSASPFGSGMQEEFGDSHLGLLGRPHELGVLWAVGVRELRCFFLLGLLWEASVSLSQAADTSVQEECESWQLGRGAARLPSVGTEAQCPGPPYFEGPRQTF